jgi:hypothetical protein
MVVCPHVSGRVLDAETRRPIAGATVQFKHFQKSPVVTPADGSFDIPEVKSLRLYPVPLPDVSGSHWQHLVVRASGYEPKELSYAPYKSHRNKTILLKHIQRSNHALEPTPDQLENSLSMTKLSDSLAAPRLVRRGSAFSR